MYIQFCKSKIAHGFITEAELLYEGSITIDEDILKAANILPGEKVDVLNVNNGNRFETYAIVGEAGSGQICLNGRLLALDWLVTRSLFCLMPSWNLKRQKVFKPRLSILMSPTKLKVHFDGNYKNRVVIDHLSNYSYAVNELPGNNGMVELSASRNWGAG